MSADNPIASLLAAPLSPDWTVEALAEQLLSSIACRAAGAKEGIQEFSFDAEKTEDRQSRRLLRPLLACLSAKSAEEAGTDPNLYEGRLFFKRYGPDGPVWISGEFENKPGSLRLVLQRSSTPSGGQPMSVHSVCQNSARL